MAVALLTRFRIHIMSLICLAFILTVFYTSFAKNVCMPPKISILRSSQKIITRKSDISPNIQEIVPKVKDLLNSYSILNASQQVEDEVAYLKMCPDFGQAIEIVFVVTSRPGNEKARNVIRRTWGSLSSEKDIAVAFIVGSTNDKIISQNIEKEQLLYGDLIRGHFLDTYDNLTIKTTWMLQWVTKYCSQARYAFKTDDDVFVHVDLLKEYMVQNKIIQNRSIYGHVVANWHPVRDKEDKYYVSESQFQQDTFPEFTTGPAYMFPTNLSNELYQEALSLPYVKLEDVFYNGIVASRLNISRVNVTAFVNNYVEWEDCILKDTITVHDISGEYFYYIWYRVNSMEKDKCK